ncbi:hypothetical protein R1A27_20095 [Methylobacterium sp. NMS12]|uniref:hypothetical protein n=1 Tax=Methylobacterium sp. NMS12 TaxID=3079766 RepID=UPI003F885909
MSKVRKVDNGFLVSDQGVWLPGLYATEDTARKAAQMPSETLQAILDRKNEEAGGSGGVITGADLAEAED